MTEDQTTTLTAAAQSRGETMMINRACEIFIDARKSIGDDLAGSSLVDLIADNSGYPLETCRELAGIVVERLECSPRLRETYGEGNQSNNRILELARVAYHGYGESVGFQAYNGDVMPAWDELPDRIQRGWRGSVVAVSLEYEASVSSVSDPGETVPNSEHHFSSGEISGISMRLITPAGEPGQAPKVIIERDVHESQLKAAGGRLSLNRDEAEDVRQYLARIFSTFWSE